MLNMLESWKGQIEVNGKQYDSVERARIENKTFSGQVHIKLYCRAKTANTAAQSASESIKSEIQNPTTYRITVKQYMTQKACAGFDFMLKWNNDVPMPLRMMTGTIEKETAGMYRMRLKGQAEATCTCMRCGRELKNPVSRYYGIGPECMAKLGMIRLDIADIDGISQKLTEIEWTGWVIKSAILSKEEV